MKGRKRVSYFACVLLLVAAAPAAAQGFGQAVLATPDELLVGESLYTDRPGTVYVYRKNAAGEWIEHARLQASDAAANDHFGRALAIAQGDLLVGATIARESGALYVFSRGQDGEWRETQSLVPNDAHPDDSFGRMAATDGNIVLMSDWAADSSGGAVYVFEKQGGSWRETAKLVSNDRAPNDWFGASLAIDGETLAIGARNRNGNRGAAYIFRRSPAGQWTQVAQIEAPDTTANLQFGAAIALVDDALLVGAPGAAGFVGAIYGFRGDAGRTSWTPTGTITPPAGTQPSGAFPNVLTRSGDEVWAGFPGTDAGSILRLARAADGQWTQRGAITVATLDQGDGFGGAVSVHEGIALVGAIGDDYGLGSALVLERRGDTWAETGRFISEDKGLDPVLGGRLDCTTGKAGQFDCGEVDLLSFLPIQQIGGKRGIRLNDVWGWTDPVTGKEWALVGRMDGTSFIDLSDPSNPVFAGDLPMTEGARANAWRDIKVYRDHAFIVADGAGQHGIQVFDLTRLRGITPAQMPMTLTADTIYTEIASAHNIVINEETGFAYSVGSSSGGTTCGGGLHMVDIREPKNPKFAGCFQDTQTGNQRTGYSHDAQCVTYNGPDEQYRGREICFGSNETMLSIADVTSKDSTIAISRAAYPNVAYAHQGWLDEQHEFFYMNDEGDEVSGTVPTTRTIVWDVRDLDDPVLAKEYFSPVPASDHNLYIVGDLMYESNYASGLRIVDISNRTEPKEVGFFDTNLGPDAPGFVGSWSNYPFFSSGTIVVTSIGEGVFFLRKKTSRPVS